MDSTLKLLKARRLALVVERDDLAVEHERHLQSPGLRCRPRFERLNDLGELRGLLVAQTRPQAHARLARAPRFNFNEGANAVVLRFVDELGIVEGRVGQRRQHGRKHC